MRLNSETASMAQRVLDHLGISYEIEKSKHYKFVITANGQKRNLITSATNSDKMAIKAAFTDLMRVLRGMGVDTTHAKAAY